MDAKSTGHPEVDRWLREAIALIDQRQYTQALEWLDRIIERSAAARAAANVWGTKSWVLHELGRTQQALEAAERALALNPASEFALVQRAAAWRRMGRDTEALRDSERAAAINPDFMAAWFSQGTVLRRMGQREAALAAYERAIARDPRSVEAWRRKGEILNDLGRHPEALPALDEALRLVPEQVTPFADVLAEKARALHGARHYEEALRVAERARTLDRANVRAWQGSSAVLRELKRYEEALAAAEQGLAGDAENPITWFLKGESLYYLDRPREALAAYDAALRLDPTLPGASARRSAMLVRLALRGELPPEIDMAQELGLADGATWGREAAMLRCLKRYDEALAACDEAIARDPDGYEWESRKGAIFLDQHRYLHAARSYARMWHMIGMHMQHQEQLRGAGKTV